MAIQRCILNNSDRKYLSEIACRDGSHLQENLINVQIDPTTRQWFRSKNVPKTIAQVLITTG